MKRIVLLGCLAACQAPDRWHTSVARGSGDIDGMGWHDFDQETTTFEVGVSGPLGFQEKPRPPAPCPPQAEETPAPDNSSGFPVTEMVLLLTGAGVLGGGQYARTKYRQRRAG